MIKELSRIEIIARKKNESYNPLPAKRVYIPKSNGGKRPLGILSYEDKIVSQIITEILINVYDSKFYDFSYGFRPNKSCHKAIRKLIQNIQYDKTNYIFETDIRGCFDNINQEWMIKFLENDIADKKLIKIIKKFLESGIMENKEIKYSEKGTPQGNQMPPVLANIFLHYILDNWVEKRFKRKIKGRMNIVRYVKINRENKGKGKPETFEFLGFTFYCSQDSKKQFYRVKVKTSNKRLHKKLREVKEWLKVNRTKKIKEIMAHIKLILIGHYNYFGVTDNTYSINIFYSIIKELLFKWLNRRSQKISYTYKEFYLKELIKYKLPNPSIKVNLLTWI